MIEQKPEVQGRESIVVEADPIILDRILTEVRGGTLVIGFSMPWYEWLTWWIQWIFIADKRIRFHLTAARIESVQISGAGRITVPSLQCNQLDVGISGAGKIVVSDIAATGVQTRVSGAGDIELTGAAGRLDARISGAGNIRAVDLSTRRTVASISGRAGSRPTPPRSWTPTSAAPAEWAIGATRRSSSASRARGRCGRSTRPPAGPRRGAGPAPYLLISRTIIS